MKSNVKIVVLLLFLVISFTGVYWLYSELSKDDPPQLDIAAQGTPALWHVTHPDPAIKGDAYLFGTIHVLPKNITWRSKKLNEAIDISDALLVEVKDLEDLEKVQSVLLELAISPNLPPVRERLAPALRENLDAVIDQSPIPEFALNRMESWAAALTLAAGQSAQLGLDPESGVEKILIAAFKNRKKKISGLETIAQQLGYFDTLPEAQQRTMLRSMAEESEDAKTSFEKLFNAWLTGDIKTLEILTTGSILEDEKIRENVLLARNRDWVSQINGLLERSGTLFIAVGAAHLVGPDSVQAGLEQQGFKIEKIQ